MIKKKTGEPDPDGEEDAFYGRETGKMCCRI